MLDLTSTTRRASALVALVALIVAVVSNTSLIRYPAFALVIGSTLATIYMWFGRDSTGLSQFSTTGTKSVDSAILLAIALLIIFANQSSQRLPDWFLVGVIGISVIIGLRIMFGAINTKLALAEISLLTLSLRWVLWTSYPLYGQDPTFHTAITGWIAQTGRLLPDGISYYQHYPASHILGATGMLIGDLGAKEAFFLTVGLAYVLALVAVYVLSRRLLQDRRGALLATLFVAISAGPLRKGSQVHAQTLAEALFPPFLLILFSKEGKRYVAAGLMLTATLLAAHNLPPLVLVGALVLITISSKIVRYIGIEIDDISGWRITNRSLTIGVIAGIGGSYFWIFIGYFDYQVNRVVSILTIGFGGATAAISTTDAAAPPAIALFGQVLPSLLFWAAPLLVLGIIGSFVGFIVLLDLAKAWGEGVTHNSPSIIYMIFGLILTGVFSVAYATGGNGPIRRSLPVVTLLVSPLFGFLMIRMRRIGIPRLGRAGLIATVIGIVVLAGVLAPAVPIADRTPQSYTPTATAQDIAMEKFSERAPTAVVSDNYLSSHLGDRELIHGERSQSPLQNVLSNDITTASDYRNKTATGAFMAYRPTYDSYYGLTVPENSTVIYNSGGNKIFVRVYPEDTTAGTA